MNKHEENRQFITCSGDMYVLIWDLLKPEQDTDAPAQPTTAIAEEVIHNYGSHFFRFLIFREKRKILSHFSRKTKKKRKKFHPNKWHIFLISVEIFLNLLKLSKMCVFNLIWVPTII